MKNAIEKKIKNEMLVVKKLTNRSTNIKIKSNEDATLATEFLVKIKNKIDLLEEERQNYTKPINESLQRINTRFKELTEPLKSTEKIIKDAIILYHREREKIRLKERAELQKKNGNINIGVIDILPDIIESKSGESRILKRWVFDIIDEKKIPREYLKVDEIKINNSINRGIKKIAGLNIYQKETLSIYR